MAGASYISGLELIPSATRVRMDQPLTLEVQFSVDGKMRGAFNQQVWTEAYDRHDTIFRIEYSIRLRSGSLSKHDVVEPVAFVRKASFYWSRNPKLEPKPPAKKIWAMIVVDDAPLLPESVEHAKSLIFDVRCPIELVGSSLGKGKHKIYAHVTAAWSGHPYTEQTEIEGRSDAVEIVCE